MWPFPTGTTIECQLHIQDFALEVDNWREGKPIDGLINNAAMGSGSVVKYVTDVSERSVEANHLKVSSSSGDESTTSLLHQHALEDEALMRVNSLGPMWVTEALLPAMARKSGEESPPCRSVVLFLGSVGGSEVHKGLFFCIHYLLC